MEAFNFATSLDLTELSVHVKIDRLDGNQKQIPYSALLRRPDLRHRASNISPHFELYVTAQIWADSKPLTIPVQTAYKSFKNARVWNEWLEIPVSYANLPASAQLAITLWDLSPLEDADSNMHAVPFGGTTIPLFDKDNTLQKGRQRCRIHRHKAADGLSNTTTPSVIPPARKSRKAPAVEDTVDEQIAEMQRLEELLKKQEMGDLPTNAWLDNLVYKKMTKIRSDALKAEAAALNRRKGTDGTINGTATDDSDVELFYLDIEFPRFDHAIVFTDVEYPPPPISDLRLPAESDIRLRPPPEVSFGPGIDVDGIGYGDSDAGRLIKIYDPEIGRRVNPAEDKHRELMRSQQTDSLDRDRKPNVHVRDKLNLLMAKGPLEEITSHERDDIWKFRYFLLRDKRALTKFVKCVNWKSPREARQAAPLLDKWAEIDVDDALELLGPHFDHPVVRSYAVERLKKADDEELQLYLLQLVQALKYEAAGEGDDSSLARFLVTRAASSFALGNFFHWYLMVEISDMSTDQEPEHRDLFAKVEYDFMVELEKTPEGVETRNAFRRQGELLTILAKISKDVRFGGGDRPTKLARLKKALADPKNELTNFEPLPLPLDPSVYITGIDSEDCNVLKSSLLPIVLNFRTSHSQKYPIIFKFGDDLRQDQLVIQIITLMDRLLRKENLDLRLTPYRILATSTSAGAFQFVPSMSIAAACQKHKGSLLAYLRANNPDPTADLGVTKEAMDTYIKSCAGYCVITYLLGVGDRHLDNLLIAPSGAFFHVDFGYILGRDPKPFAPQMKLCREMIEGMGGATHPNYLSFKEYAFTAWSTLRKSSNLLLNLFALMQGANIPDIKVEREGSVRKVQERMWMGKSEGEAAEMFERLVEESMGDWKAGVIDWAHEFVQTYWRK
ncbi:phosphatidylinositol 3-kinase [Didymella exigua CBS 183.55]|uniref:Phosphatidylinositol 3-kinase VPS34 n=1 Tax=Didymella exigua CBS 183.55 TaxID=1150837 RepID=A0A6A5RIN2_9PLEO|nr:phosphatidylinositol 3-kinase [Didymella exigua CBS 183.55]KAF1927323.1 phosphatidylinositol 3-kinase [Didymella exigua CBS 183.55]